MRRTKFLPPLRRLSKQDVLDTIRDSYRFSRRFDPDTEDIDLAFETTVGQWRDACDLLPADRLGESLSIWFDALIDVYEWRATLEPAETATLGDVCELLAERARVPGVEPLGICGTKCETAGAFLTIRSALAREGAPVRGLRPSTPIETVARSHLAELVRALGIVAPNTLPLPKVEHRLAWRIGVWLVLAGLLATPVALFVRSLPPSLLAGILLLAGFFALRRAGGNPFRTISFPGMTTFRDLTEAVIRRK
jgi:hypothetical protein